VKIRIVRGANRISIVILSKTIVPEVAEEQVGGMRGRKVFSFEFSVLS
jgi:hypothetical protein